MKFTPLGDAALIVNLSEEVSERDLKDVTALALVVREAGLGGVIDVVPAYTSVAIFYDPAQVSGSEGGPYSRLIDAIAAHASPRQKAARLESTDESRSIEITVFYGGDDGPDLAAVATHTGLSQAQVIRLHSEADYLVQAIGFAPGFPYLSGLPVELATPRRVTPRLKVPAGSVGIGGAQTGIYPVESPGGWHLIGRTDAHLFDMQRAELSLLRVGDTVKFKPQYENRPLKPPAKVSLADHQPAAQTVKSGLRVLSPGLFTTVQDLGRFGFRHAGVPASGALDPSALRVANVLVGNEETLAGLEMTLIGPEIEFQTDGLIALGGAEFEGCENYRPVMVRAGQRIKFGAAVRGCRGYLAVAGGITVTEVLGSRSTYVRGGLGGLEGRTLRIGDFIPLGSVVRGVVGRWHIDPKLLPAYETTPTVRVVLGSQGKEFGETWRAAAFKVTPQVDRMGMRLSGEALMRASGGELLSSPVAPGTIQVPPDGQPIVLMADAQTIGGYPQIAHVIDVDVPLLAQSKPGDTLRLAEVTLAQAHELWLAREINFAMLREGLAHKFC